LSLLELVAENNKALTGLNFFELWVLSVFDISLEFLFSGLLVLIFAREASLFGSHLLNPSNSVVLNLELKLVLEMFLTKFILGLVNL